MIKPDILVIGAAKAATSTVCSYLEDHPDVWMVKGAEPNFFSHDENWIMGPEWYDTWFEGAAPHQLISEGSNAYAAPLKSPDTAARIRSYAPDVKLVYMVRHPIDRIVSAWIQLRQNRGDYVGPDINEAVRSRRAHLVGESAYWARLQPFRAVFPDEQIFVSCMEDLVADQPRELRRLAEFLGIDPDIEMKARHANPSKGKAVPSATLTRLRQMPLLRHIKRLVPADARRRIVRKTLYTKLESRPQLSRELHAELAAELREDSAALLRYLGKPADYWRLEPT